MNKIYFLLQTILTVILCAWVLASTAAPLPNNTLLAVKAGTGSAVNTRCTAGSCIGMGLMPGLIFWQDISPGIDGGLVIGKQQSLAPSYGPLTDICQLAYVADATTGQTSCFITAPSAEKNIFDDTPCDGIACVGKTEIKSLSIFNAVNLSAFCYPTQSCPGVTKWVVNWLAANPLPYYYELDYQWTITSGIYTGIPIYLHLEGSVIPLNSAPVAVITPSTITVNPGDMVNLDGSASYDPDGTITCHTWTVPGMILPAVCTPTLSFTTPTVDFIKTIPVTLTVTDNGGLQSSTTATVTVVPRTACQDKYPIRRITTIGAGGTMVINKTMSATFTGHIVSSTESYVFICRDTLLDYEITSTVGQPYCFLNGRLVPPAGKLRTDSRLLCSNRPLGYDKDKYFVLPY